MSLIGCTQNKENKEDHEPSENPEIEDDNQKVEDKTQYDPEETEDEEPDLTDSESNKDLFDRISNLPTDAGGFIHYQTGPFADVDVVNERVSEEVLREIRALEPLDEEANDEQLDDLFTYMYVFTCCRGLSRSPRYHQKVGI